MRQSGLIACAIRCLVNKSALENETAREKRVAFEARAAVSEEQLEQAMAAARERAANRWRTDLEKSAENAESAQREEEVAKVRCHEWLKGEPRVAWMLQARQEHRSPNLGPPF